MTTTTTLNTGEMRLELVNIPVTDIDRARDFYVQQCGWTLITDHVQMDDMRIVQIVPPGSHCGILLGRNIPGITEMVAGSQKGIHLAGARRGCCPRPAGRQRRQDGRDPGPRLLLYLPVRGTRTATCGSCSSGRTEGPTTTHDHDRDGCARPGPAQPGLRGPGRPHPASHPGPPQARAGDRDRQTSSESRSR